ncbi:MAG TPA: dTDP-4-dehydrorhamnose 3,5-epimerase family protein [Terriglobales bacterium]|nr:dTDP-4-dehydrorhamnose 3,5-epimerase family protein [Terriglobales bacterium]
MLFTQTSLHGVVLVDTEPKEDIRGSFRRLWCQREVAAAALPTRIVQTSLSVTNRRGTLRGMHFQLPPSREDKLIHCVRGRIFDVALDLRRGSPSYLRHFSVELAASDSKALFIPSGCAHGFLTLSDDCSVLYMMTDFYDPALQSGVRWDDPAFAIDWPERPKEILPRDASYVDFDPGSVDGFSDGRH